jgi:hypothetical protein
MSDFPSLDDLIDTAITDLHNLKPEADTSQLTLTFNRIVVFMIALWGLYKKLADVKKQFSPLTCDTAMLDGWCASFGITRLGGETDYEMLDRLLLQLREPPAGGNASDYEAWTKSISLTPTEWEAESEYAVGDVVVPTSITSDSRSYICTVAGTADDTEPSWPAGAGDTVTDGEVTWKEWNAASFVERATIVRVFKLARGVGTLDIVIFTNNESAWCYHTASQALLDAIFDYIDGDDVRPVGDADFTVQTPSKKSMTIEMSVPAGTSPAVKAKIKSDVIAYIKTLGTGDTLYPSALTAIVVYNGVPSGTTVLPAAPVTCYPTGNAGHYERIWADDGDISFTEV